MKENAKNTDLRTVKVEAKATPPAITVPKMSTPNGKKVPRTPIRMRDSKLPWGIIFIQKFTRMRVKECHMFFFVLNFILTHLIYSCFHMIRKLWSVVKTILHRDCSKLIPPPGTDPEDMTWCQWAPFDTPNGDQKLALIDTCYLAAYSIAMFFSGPIAERMNLRIFLTIGMVLLSIFTIGLGMAHVWEVHDYYYFIIMQICLGICSTFGWPVVVTVMGKWMSPGYKGLIYGIWNSHTPIGNIIGSVISGSYVEEDWSKCFIIPAIILLFVALLAYLFLIPDPKDLEDADLIEKYFNYSDDESSVEPVLDNNVEVVQEIRSNRSRTSESSTMENDVIITISETAENSGNPASDQQGMPRAISFIGALAIPGVIAYSMTLFFTKSVNYTFLFWLVKYINVSTNFSPKESSRLSTFFDWGGTIGSPIIGYLSDRTGKNACVCIGMLLVSCPMLFLFNYYNPQSYYVNAACLLALGMIINAPYSLITTSISADLGTHPSLGSNAKAMATVSSIIDGTGSVGATVGPYAAGYVSAQGWAKVFYLLIGTQLLAVSSITNLGRKEITSSRWFRRLFRRPSLEEGSSGSQQRPTRTDN